MVSPKEHKAKTSFRPIVSACGTSINKSAQYLSKVLQLLMVMISIFVEDSKGLVECLTEQNADETWYLLM